MKAFVCGYCADIQALQREWRTCRCGVTSAHWVDPLRGTAEFRRPQPPAEGRNCFLLGLNNRLLEPAIRGELAMFQDFREAHDRATDAPNHVFDKSRAACWAVVVRAGQTADVTWADEGAA